MIAGVGAAGWPRALRADGQDVASLARAAEDWALWKATFLTEDGRVVDHLQDDASHSEGQAYGMLLAAWFGDEPTLNRIQAWTSQYLAVRQDPLLAWRWTPAAQPQVTDYNNATDGDIFHAWALHRAGTRFGIREFQRRAEEVVRFLVASCIRPDPRGGGRMLLLPGAERFETGQRITVNPSYYMPLALRELGVATNTPEFLKCADDGETLLAELAAVGPVPDWIEIGPEGWRHAPGHTAQSGYDAIRSALFLIWSGRFDHPAVVRASALYRLHEGTSNTPTVFDRSGSSVLATSDLPGYAAVATLVRCATNAGRGHALPTFSSQQPYFPATLHLFAQIAARSSGLAC